MHEKETKTDGVLAAICGRDFTLAKENPPLNEN